MGISRGQMQRQLYASGGIRSLVPREHYGLGSIFKKAARAVKKVVSSDVGKLALLAAGAHFMIPGGLPGMWGTATSAISNMSGWQKAAALGGLGLFAGKSVPKQEQFKNTARAGNISSYLRDYYTRMYPNKSEEEINELIETNTSEYAAEGGRMGFDEGGIINGRTKFYDGSYFDGDEEMSAADVTSFEMGSGMDDIDDIYSAADAASYAGGQGMQTVSEFVHGDLSPTRTPSHGGNVKNPNHPAYNPNEIYEHHGITPYRGGMGPPPLINAQTTESNTYLRQYYRNMYPNKTEEEIDELMEGNTQSAAEGGRMGYALGTNGNGWHQGDWTDPNDPDYEPKPQKLAENTDALQSLLKEFIETHKRYPKDMEELKRWALKRMQGGTTEEESTSLAEILPEKQDGGRIGYALGPRDPGLQSAVGDIPTRQNDAGVTELDFRDNGGFVPPIGIKEKADDIPAMVSNNEFVFTADAVKAAGGGNVDKGAQRMYDLMKQLEGKIA